MATSDLTSSERKSVGGWWKSGAPWIWLNATAVGTSIVAVLGLLSLLAVRGLAHFWPSEVLMLEYRSDTEAVVRVIGEVTDSESISRRQYQEATSSDEANLPDVIERQLIKTGNRRAAAPDFRWLYSHRIESAERPAEVIVFERTEWGHAYGFLETVHEAGSSATPAT